MELSRQNPDALLRAIGADKETGRRGRLKIFFGYAAGVGKTYAMLRASHQAAERGIDVVAGYIEPHARPQTMALLEGLEVIPTRQVAHGGSLLPEFDLDAALRRRPQLILVDEYAHTNAEGSRHAKRYQDVEELLNAGIDVFTTVNVQHIESLNDTVASITGILVRERIPDSAFDRADQVELVDLEPAELLERLKSGCVYREKQARRAVVNFFTIENLTALRELSLRRCADRVNRLTECARIQSGGDYHTGEHILVCLSSSPSNAKIIRTAARMAHAFRGSFTALFVETPATELMSEENKKRLQDNRRLAQQLGAVLETTCGEDVPFQIAEFARLSGVSKIVIGRSTIVRRSIFSKPTLTERLIEAAPNLDIHVIPDAAATKGYRERRPRSRQAGMAAAAVFAWLLVFLLIIPRWTVLSSNPHFLVPFLLLLPALLLAGSLTLRLKEAARQASRTAYRTEILLETNQLLQGQADESSVLAATAGQLIKLLGRDIVTYLPDGDGLGEPCVCRAPGSAQEDLTTENEAVVADWVLRNNKHAGATTDTMAGAKCLYLAIRVNRNVYGVVGIAMKDTPLDIFENSILLSILGECALMLENIKNAKMIIPGFRDLEGDLEER